ncbi:MAG: DNA polymerase III subunit delta [Candidatus Dasytiphilus stammeri]
MIRVYSEQLEFYLDNNKFRYRCYILAGKDPLLLKESEEIIRKHASKLGFYEYLNVIFNLKNDWNEIINNFKKQSLFGTRRILRIILSNRQFSPLWKEKFFSLIKLLHLHLNIILIIIIPYDENQLEKRSWLDLFQSSVVVDCSTPETYQLPKWICRRAEKMGLKIHKNALNWICYNYERNLLALVQILELLDVLLPDGIVTLSRIENLVNDMAYFDSVHWVEAVLKGDSNRAFHILDQLRKQGSEISSLCYVLQRYLMTLLLLHIQISTTPLKILFHQYRIIYRRQLLFKQALQRLNRDQIQKSLCLLVDIEVSLKQSYEDISLLWIRLENLSLLLSNNTNIENVDLCMY